MQCNATLFPIFLETFRETCTKLCSISKFFLSRYISIMMTQREVSVIIQIYFQFLPLNLALNRIFRMYDIFRFLPKRNSLEWILQRKILLHFAEDILNLVNGKLSTFVILERNKLISRNRVASHRYIWCCSVKFRWRKKERGRSDNPISFQICVPRQFPTLTD